MENIIIKCVTPSCSERTLISDFIKSQYERRMKVIPPLPEIVFAAIQDGKVLGTVGLEFVEHEEHSLPCEKIFSFDWSVLRLSATRALSVQYSRWAVIHESVSKNIVRIATLYALDMGRQYGLCELKPAVAKRLQQIGVLLYEITVRHTEVSAIEDSVRHYYLTQPYPKLYQLDLSQMAQALA